MRVGLKDGGGVEAQMVVNAALPVMDLTGLKLKNAGVEVLDKDEGGGIKADDHLSNTNIEGIYAIGAALN